MANKARILCIVPLPPPITGAAIASRTIVNNVRKHHEVIVLPYQRGNLITGKFSLIQMFRVIAIGIRLKLIKKKFAAVYFVISTSYWGNLRDLCFLIMMGKRLRERTVLHLQANIDTSFNAFPFWVRYLNRKLLRNVKKAIVLGESFVKIFGEYIGNDKIKIVRNYFSPELLVRKEDILAKYKSPEIVNILFLSNLLREKGYEVLLQAFLSLFQGVSSKAALHFAGEINSSRERKLFLKKIVDRKNVFYHGAVAGEEKRRLLWTSHIFCLPTFYRYEAQPISILEAYASGCIVITTKMGGINDIFVNHKNGFLVEKNDVVSLREKLEMTILDLDKYKDIAINNFKEASEKYSEEIFCRDVVRILLSDH